MMLTAAVDPAVKEINGVDLTQDLPAPPEIIDIETYVCNIREDLTRIKAEPGLLGVQGSHHRPAGSGRQEAVGTLKVWPF